LPVVPDEAWSLVICSRGTANSPSGYVSRRSLFRVNGSERTSSTDSIDAGSTSASRSR